MDDVEIRPFDDGDEAGVIALWETVFPDDPPHNDPATVVRRKLAVQRELFLVATLDERIAGTVIAGFDGYRGWVYHLAVAPHLRRRGYGARLMAEAESRLAAIGCPKLNLQVRATNQEVIAFYRALGYAEEARVSMGKHLARHG